MNPNTASFLASILNSPSPKVLDTLITLQEVSLPTQLLDALWQAAQQTGEAWHNAYWQNSLSLEENLQKLGLKKLRLMSGLEETALPARALYDPDSCEIAISRRRLDETMLTMSPAEQTVFNRRTVWETLVKHEFFIISKRAKHFVSMHIFRSTLALPCPLACGTSAPMPL